MARAERDLGPEFANYFIEEHVFFFLSVLYTHLSIVLVNFSTNIIGVVKF